MKIDINKPMEVVWTHKDGTDEVIPVKLYTEYATKPDIWVLPTDGRQCFPNGDHGAIKFNRDGSSPFSTFLSTAGYQKPAILRNVKETIMSDYTNFEPFTGGINFRSFPLNVRVIDNQGNIETLNLRGASDMALIANSVAISFEKVDPLRVEAQRLLDAANKRGPFGTSRRLIEEVLRIQQEESPKVDVNLTDKDRGRMPTWFYGLMEDCGIFTATNINQVWNWYMDTGNPNHGEWRLPTTLARKLDNRLLSFRPWSGGGQLVITPHGHGLAMTNAKKVYWMWKDRDFRSAYGMGSHENTGRYKPNYGKRTITVTSKGVDIGCQHIPHMAFTRLAERLGWPDKDPYGY